MIRLVRLLLSLMVIQLVAGFMYEIVVDDRIFIPCDDYPDFFLNKYITYPRNFTVLPNDRVYIEGDAVIVYDFKPKDYPATVDFYKKGRGGTWEKTLYSFSRPDLCKPMFDQSEIWYSYFKELPIEQQKCPLFKGQIFTVDYSPDQEVNLPSNSLEGEYRAVFKAGIPTDEDGAFCCAEAYFTLYRI